MFQGWVIIASGSVMQLWLAVFFQNYWSCCGSSAANWWSKQVKFSDQLWMDGVVWLAMDFLMLPNGGSHCLFVVNQIKSKFLVFGADSTVINDQGCQHVTGRFESIWMPLDTSAEWRTLVRSHLSVKTVVIQKKQLPLNLPTYRKEEN